MTTPREQQFAEASAEDAGETEPESDDGDDAWETESDTPPPWLTLPITGPKPKMKKKSREDARGYRGLKPWPEDEIFRIRTEDDWDLSRIKTGIHQVCIDWALSTYNHHLLKIANACRKFPNRIRSFTLRPSRNSHGELITNELTNSSVIKLAQSCPHLYELQLESSLKLRSNVIFAILKACPELRSLCITGTAETQGSINASVLAKLSNDRPLGGDLVQLYLAGQPINSGGFVTKLSNRRRILQITVGTPMSHSVEENITVWQDGEIIVRRKGNKFTDPDSNSDSDSDPYPDMAFDKAAKHDPSMANTLETLRLIKLREKAGLSNENLSDSDSDDPDYCDFYSDDGFDVDAYIEETSLSRLRRGLPDHLQYPSGGRAFY